MLVDNVSKNGNLLLNVVQRPDGSLDPEVETMLEQLAAWTAIHGEAIYGSRPWLVYGESAIKVKGGNFKEDFKYNAKEIRFTTRGATLYATAIGWPEDGQLVIRSLAKPAGENVNNITTVSLLGYSGKVDWKQTADGLVVTLPAQKVSEFTAALKITGTDLKNISFIVPTAALTPDAKGNLVLSPDDAELDGGVKTEAQGGQPSIGFWDNPQDSVSWKVRFPQAGTYEVTTACAASAGPSELAIDVAGQKVAARISQTKSWSDFLPVSFGKVTISAPGELVVTVRAANAARWKAVNLRAVKFTPVR
jgi:alpha-L-fucosidase